MMSLFEFCLISRAQKKVLCPEETEDIIVQSSTIPTDVGKLRCFPTPIVGRHSLSVQRTGEAGKSEKRIASARESLSDLDLLRQAFIAKKQTAARGLTLRRSMSKPMIVIRDVSSVVVCVLIVCGARIQGPRPKSTYTGEGNQLDHPKDTRTAQPPHPFF